MGDGGLEKARSRSARRMRTSNSSFLRVGRVGWSQEGAADSRASMRARSGSRLTLVHQPSGIHPKGSPWRIARAKRDMQGSSATRRLRVKESGTSTSTSLIATGETGTGRCTSYTFNNGRVAFRTWSLARHPRFALRCLFLTSIESPEADMRKSWKTRCDRLRTERAPSTWGTIGTSLLRGFGPKSIASGLQGALNFLSDSSRPIEAFVAGTHKPQAPAWNRKPNRACKPKGPTAFRFTYHRLLRRGTNHLGRRTIRRRSLKESL
jgi:hypothetical protein